MHAIYLLLSIFTYIIFCNGNKPVKYQHTENTACDSNIGYCIDITIDSCTDGILKTGYCPGDSNIQCCEPSTVLPERCYGSGPPLLNNSYEFTLENQGFSGYPGALVYVPSTFSKASTDLEVIVYIHGYNNCIRNIVRSTSDACNCTEGYDVREAYNLIEQFELAMITINKTNSIFIAAEVAYDQANDSPGRWAENGLFHNFLDELLTIHLSSIIGDYTINNIQRVRIYSHSGGYYTIGNMAIVGNVNQVYELCLLDSLYADMNQFNIFIQDNIQLFGLYNNNYRFSSIYSLNGGTLKNNEIMALQIKLYLKSNNINNNILIIDNTNISNYNDIISNYSLIFKYTSLEHNDIPRELFYDFLINAI